MLQGTITEHRVNGQGRVHVVLGSCDITTAVSTFMEIESTGIDETFCPKPYHTKQVSSVAKFHLGLQHAGLFSYCFLFTEFAVFTFSQIDICMDLRTLMSG